MIEFLNQWGQEWGRFFGLMTLQNTIFMGFLFLALRLLKNSSARIKYTIMLIGLFKLLMPPFLSLPFLPNPSSGPIQILASEPIPVAPTTITMSSMKLNLSGILFLIWIIAVVISVMISVISSLRLNYKIKMSKPVQVDAFKDKINKKKMNIYKTKSIEMPITMGLFSSKIYVPLIWDQWSPECKEMIIHHELAHIKRWDNVMQIFQILVQALYFFHPLVWHLSARLNEYREMACDDNSITVQKSSSIEYSRVLVEIAENMTEAQLSSLSASALIRQKNKLLKRVQYQIEEDKMRYSSKFKIGAILTVLFLLVAPLSWTLTQQNPQENEIAANTDTFSQQEETQPPIMTGKIYGTITDNETGEPLWGANVYLKGTSIGGAADQNGQFWISNVPPGTYILTASYMGYKSVEFRDVRVSVSESTQLDAALDQVILNTYDLQEKDFTSSPSPHPIEGQPMFVPWEQPPSPIGEMEALQNNLTYPESAKEAGVAGTVEIATLINKDGEVIETKILKSLDPACDAAAIKTIQESKWKPAMQRDLPVEVWVSVPLTFEL